MKLRSNMRKIEDYRLTNGDYNSRFFDVQNKKKEYMIFFKENHPKTNNVYYYARNKREKENLKFREIYSYRCAYCGVNTKVIDSSKFEIDHFIPKSITNKKEGLPDYLLVYTEEGLNSIGNLVCSCQVCNRWKVDFYCGEELNATLTHPDNNSLNQVFVRNENFEISISKKYQSNPDVMKLFSKLRLGDQLRRIDFFLMELHDFFENLEPSDPLYDKIATLLIKIDKKRKFCY